MRRDAFFVRFGIPLVAAGLLGFTAWSLAANYNPRAVTTPSIPAPVNPFNAAVAASGIIEPASEVIAIAIERGGVVSHVDVVAGDNVTAGQPLFGVDNRAFRAAVQRQEAAVAAAQAAVNTAEQNIAQQRFVIAQAAANLASAKAENKRAASDRERYGALARDEWASRQRLETVDADAGKAAAGAAAAEAATAAARQRVDVLTAQQREAEAQLVVAKAALQQAHVDLDRTVVRAPISGEILKVDVRLGEYAQAQALASPLMTMGKVDPLHVRADIDEDDSWRVCPDSPAVARLRGNPDLAAPLSFVRFEPYVLAKRSLTNAAAERVDTRVLQTIYAFPPESLPAFVGQQVDVFIEAPLPGTVTDRERAGARCRSASWPVAAQDPPGRVARP